MTRTPPVLAITLGDPCGVGPELLARVIAGASRDDLDRWIGCGPFAAFQQAFHRLFPRRRLPPGLRWQDVGGPGPFPVGAVSAAGGRAAVAAIEAAHALCLAGTGAGMVTGPIGKEAIRLAGSPFAGHTDMLQALAGVPATRMAMVHGRFRVVMTTLHVAWREVPRLLTETAVYETILAAHTAFATRRRPHPVIAVAGLNPHAGEHGLFGDEEERAIRPAIDRARRDNPNVTGPWPADSLFKADRRRATDVFVAQTHDQGLIAIKVLGGLRCVNVTLGLPYVRTSVGHGTAYDIAGRGQADHRGLLAALRQADRLARTE
ncbi:MAG: 4-hydroxythreonine-4-phosphate dehydrogenase PdxA [Candidatus Riflebacteria bacterium]|nr:4-hydroxythreonine-4-phosphate dehydrogenase PdxA [Candidatus Riflebacteria bacterium]